jgi:hypothetical protein
MNLPRAGPGCVEKKQRLICALHAKNRRALTFYRGLFCELPPQVLKTTRVSGVDLFNTFSAASGQC